MVIDRLQGDCNMLRNQFANKGVLPASDVFYTPGHDERNVLSCQHVAHDFLAVAFDDRRVVEQPPYVKRTIQAANYFFIPTLVSLHCSPLWNKPPSLLVFQVVSLPE